jgi:hypothetical protein
MMGPGEIVRQVYSKVLDDLARGDRYVVDRIDWVMVRVWSSNMHSETLVYIERRFPDDSPIVYRV